MLFFVLAIAENGVKKLLCSFYKSISAVGQLSSPLASRKTGLWSLKIDECIMMIYNEARNKQAKNNDRCLN